MMLQEEREQIRDLIRELMVVRESLAELEKAFSKIGIQTIEIYAKLDGMLDAD